MQRSGAQARKASLAESILEAISELMSSVAAADVEQENFMDVGSHLHHAPPATMELQRAQNSPTNVMHVIEYLAANVDLAKDLVSRCSAVAQQLMDDDLQSITEDLDNVIKNIGHEISRIPASAFGSNRFADAAVDAHLQVAGNRQHPCDQRSCDGYSEADMSIVVANDRPRRRTLHNSDMPRLVDFLQGMYHEAHEFGGQSFSSLPEVAEYVEPLYDSFFCPLTNKVMFDPVTTESGVIYDRRAIEEYFEKFTDGTEPVICPVTKMAMQRKTLRSNVPLKSTIAEWIMRNEATRVRIARTALSLATTEAMVLEAIHELKLLARLRRRNREQMHKIGITKFLARLLEHKDALIRCDSLDLLCLLVEDDAGKEIIAKTRAIAVNSKRVSVSHIQMAASVMASLALKPSPSPLLGRSKLRGARPSARPSLLIVAKGKKIQTSQPYGPAGGVIFKEGVDASGRAATGKGLYQFSNKYGANVDGYSPIYTPEEWSSSGDVYVGGKTGLFLWAVTLAGILLGGALLVYNTSALAS